MNNDQILAILIAAKQRYLSMTFQGCAVGFPGMCFCIKQEAKEICPLISYSYIPSLILNLILNFVVEIQIQNIGGLL